MLTLWDLARPSKRRRGARRPPHASNVTPAPTNSRQGPKAQLYASMTRELLDEHFSPAREIAPRHGFLARRLDLQQSEHRSAATGDQPLNRVAQPSMILLGRTLLRLLGGCSEQFEWLTIETDADSGPG